MKKWFRGDQTYPARAPQTENPQEAALLPCLLFVNCSLFSLSPPS